MQVVQKIQELDKVLESLKASTVSQYTGKIKNLIGKNHVFIHEKEAFIAKRDMNIGGKIVAIPLMPYCKGTDTTGPEMSDKEIGDFARAGGEIIK